jgi:hypothetical protein
LRAYCPLIVAGGQDLPARRSEAVRCPKEEVDKPFEDRVAAWGADRHLALQATARHGSLNRLAFTRTPGELRHLFGPVGTFRSRLGPRRVLDPPPGLKGRLHAARNGVPQPADLLHFRSVDWDTNCYITTWRVVPDPGRPALDNPFARQSLRHGAGLRPIQSAPSRNPSYRTKRKKARVAVALTLGPNGCRGNASLCALAMEQRRDARSDRD